MRKKIIYWGWGIGSLLMAVASILWIAPAFVDSSFLKQKIQAEIRRQKVGELDYLSARLAFFPSPCLTIRNIEFSASDTARAGAEKILIYPELLPLFRGRLRLSKIVVNVPVFTLDISDKHPVNGDSGEDPGPFSPSEWMADAMGPLAAHTSGLKVVVDRGNVQINRGGQEKLFIKDVDLDAGLTVTASGSFNSQLNIGRAMLIVSPKDRKVIIDCNRLQAALHVDENQVRFTLDELKLKQPAMELSGRFVASPDTSGFSLDLNGKDLDVHAIREAALDLGGENEMVGYIFSYIKGGRIPAIRIQSSGKTLADLGDLENIVIQGRMLNGDIAIDDIGLTLAEVNGEALISKGLLEASGASAAIGETRGHAGSLKLGLAEDNYTFHLDVAIDAELNQLPSVLKNIIDHEAFVAELSLISDVNGKGRGRLILGDRIDDIYTRLEVYEMNFSAAYQRLPFPVNVNSGKLFLEDIFIRVEDIGGSVGSSVFSGITGKVEWENRLHVDIPAGLLDLDLEEFYPWVSSIEALGEDLADVKDVKGRLRLSAFTLAGPDDDNDPSGQWQVSAAGEADNVIIDSTRLGEMLYLSSGSLQVAPPNRISFRNLHARWLDASLDLTGTLEGDINKPHLAEVSINGELGENVLAMFAESGRLPKDYALQSPVKLTNTDILWRSGGDVSFKGELFFPQGPHIITDIYHKPGELTIHRLDIKDEDSAVECAFGLKKDRINLAFKGSLESKTLHRILASEKIPAGRLKGDITLAFVKDNVSESTIKGRLEGENIMAPMADNAPLLIETFRISAENNIIKVDHVALSYLENRVKLTGHGDMTADALILKLDASAGDVKWAFSDKQTGEATESKEGNSGVELWGYPVHAGINLSADSFSLGEYTWRPFHAGVDWNQGKVKIEVIEANLCGIDTLGTLLLDGDNLDLDFYFSASDREFIASYECLSKNRIEMTGAYDLSGQIQASGPADALFGSATGNFDFNARNGVITQSKTLSRILEVVNFTEIVKGKIPDLKSEGFSYETLSIQGEFGSNQMKNNLIMFNKIYMDGKTLNLLGQGTLDLELDKLKVELLAAPFKTVDTAIKHIPGVNYLMAGTLISIPIRIRGEMADPKVRVMKASDISSHFLDFAERTIKSPVRLIQHWNPYNKSDEQGSPQ